MFLFLAVGFLLQTSPKPVFYVAVLRARLAAICNSAFFKFVPEIFSTESAALSKKPNVMLIAMPRAWTGRLWAWLRHAVSHL